VLFIFDPMDVMGSELVDATWDESLYVYKVFDGAWFNVKYAIEHDWKDKRVVLLFPDGTYPKEEEQQLRFPLMDMLKANMEYKEEDYASFMQQYSLPEVHRAFIRSNIAEIMSAKVQALISGYLTPELFSPEMVCRAFISCYMGEKKLLDWDAILIKLLIMCAASDSKKRIDTFIKIERNLAAKKALDERLTRMFGFSFNPNHELKLKEVAESLKYNCLTQSLAANAADLYKAYKITNTVALDSINKLYERGVSDRLLADKFVAALTTLSRDVKESELIAVYGVYAPYCYMTEQLYWPIAEQVVKVQLATDPSGVNDRMRSLAQKMPEGSPTQPVTRVIMLLAQFYDKLRSLDTLKLNTPEEYVQLYLRDFYSVDMLYRHALEAYHETIHTENPIEQVLSQAKKQLDQEYAKLTNVLNLEWLTCVEEKGDAFASLSLSRQEDFYARECDATVKQVIIVSDALRYEVAVELMQELAADKYPHKATLTAYRAMLPTETKYCKNALLPHQALEWSEKGVLVDGQDLTDTADKTAHLEKYRKGAICKRYEDIINEDITRVRELFKQHPLVYIMHDEIDSQSHSQSPFSHIQSCRTAIEQLKVLVKRLHASWNVTSVVITADHGFIYHDIDFEEKDKHSIREDSVEKKTRYYLTKETARIEGFAKFPLSEVSGMKQTKDIFVSVPLGTNRLAAPGGYNFAHGGAALQEIIIPVINSRRKGVEKTEKVGASLMNHNLTMVSSRLKVQVIQSEAVTVAMMERKIACAIYNGDVPVTAEQVITLNSTDAANLNNRIYDLTFTLNQQVSASVLELRIYDVEDHLNPLIRETVKNSTMIDMDF
jgi:hypothetical protein